MALSPAQLADAIVQYLKEDEDRFAKFLYKRHKVHVDVHFNGEVEDRKRRVITVETLDNAGQPLHDEKKFALRIDLVQ